MVAVKIVFGIIMFVSIIYSFLIKVVIMNLKMRKYEEKIHGTIISVRESCIKGNHYNYYPTYRYIVDGVIYEEELAFPENKEENLPIGEVRILQYDEKNPKNFFPIMNKKAWLMQSIKKILIAIFFIAYIYYLCK
ncbi:hypothetical protein [Lacrimispora sp. 38-1]|uniref:hypothetical protein n=1 Tax=Lacrimispora sp. 38-1 TaxID=3125778 RepID=UPI003CF7494C